MLNEAARNDSNDSFRQYNRLVRQRDELQMRKANGEIDLRQYALNTDFYTPEKITAIREQYEKITQQLNAVVREIDEQLKLDPALRDGLERKFKVDVVHERVGLTRLIDIESKPVRWLWRDRIPLGKITILDGDPGLGKSLLSLDLAARLTTGRAMPDGTEGLDQPAGVVLLSAEDDPEDTIRPRLEAAGADLSRIAILSSIREDDGERLPTLLDLAAIRHAINEIDAKLVVIDPLMAYLPSAVNAFRDQDIRRALAPPARLAAETGVAVLVLRHLNKAMGGNALYRGGGSIGIIGAARSGLIVAKDPDDDERRILAVSKSNLAKIPPALAYRVVADAAEIPSLAWEGTTAHTASMLLAIPRDGEDRSALEEAKDFLRDVLANGAIAARDVQKQADQAGIQRRTLRRAKDSLSIQTFKRGGFFAKDKGQQWSWQLPAEDGHGLAEDDHIRKFGRLQQSGEKISRNFNDVAEDDQGFADGHLQQPYMEEV